MESRNMPKPGEFYRHFKNHLYQIITVAEHTETGEQLVVYQALYGSYGIYARPVSMFLSEVDHEKYPDVVQTYRFEKTDLAESPKPVEEKKSIELPKEEVSETKQLTGRRINYTQRKDLSDFLDADSYEEKRQILLSMQSYIDEFTLDSMAVCLDFVADGKTVEEKYYSILKFLAMKHTYEGKR